LNREDLFRRESAGHDDEEEKPEGGENPLASRQVKTLILYSVHVFPLFPLFPPVYIVLSLN
jgi:hypothetical protein